MLHHVINGRYRIVRFINQGGMGAVYEAHDQLLDRRVAIKSIVNEAAKKAWNLTRFAREQQVAASIDSPHVAALLDGGIDEETGGPFMVMEYLVGEDLRSRLNRVAPISSAAALRVVGQACRGLIKVHEASVIHRDIKPGNIFLTRSDDGSIRVQLLDFGVAKVQMELAAEVDPNELTRTGMMLGSPRYMSPEQARSSKALDLRSDIWSLGIVLYEALTGVKPYAEAEALGEVILLICTVGPAPIQDVAPWVPPSVAAILHNALQLQPDQRYRSAAAMLASIEEVLQGRLDLHESMLGTLSDQERKQVYPRFVPPPAAPGTMPPPPRAPRPKPATGVARILIVEDNELNMDMLSRRLERSGYQVLRAFSGEDGLAMGRAEQPELVLMDVTLPGIDGWETTRRLRKAEETRSIPVIALTARATAGDRETAQRAGCDDYETKPIEFKRLLLKIETLIKRGAA